MRRRPTGSASASLLDHSGLRSEPINIQQADETRAYQHFDICAGRHDTCSSALAVLVRQNYFGSQHEEHIHVPAQCCGGLRNPGSQVRAVDAIDQLFD